jgi:hypothetical protein
MKNAVPQERNAKEELYTTTDVIYETLLNGLNERHD